MLKILQDQILFSVKHLLTREILQEFTKSSTKASCLFKGMEWYSVTLSQLLLVKTIQYNSKPTCCNTILIQH